MIEHGVKRERAAAWSWMAGRPINAGRYTRVQYDCSSPALARQLTQLAAQIGLADPQFRTVGQTPMEQIAQLPRPSPNPPPPAAPAAIQTPSAAVCAPVAPEPASKVDPSPSARTEPGADPLPPIYRWETGAPRA